ncbi:MAG: hypothetical protein H7Y07_10765 [Pyrinomonadaceae bacterium]|nr:hypothetical protein [Sphingobacteriaceae bacterium]
MQKEYKQLTSLPFLAGLGILLANDLVLKEYFHNYFTGKISDFCGLFVFAIFWSVLFPKRKALVFFITALLFILWKSPYSQAFINLFSEYVFVVQRIVDISDLMALLILPFAWIQLAAPQKASFTNPWVAGLLTLFSFCATSVAGPIERFEQPQYVLFESPNFSPATAEYFGYDIDFKFYKFDNLIVIGVENILIDEYPAKEDDFQKNLILKDLDKRVIQVINLYQKGYYSLNKPIGNHTLVIETDGIRDSLNFSGSRLNGEFTRTDSTGKVLIKGQYKNGIEDLTWIFVDSVGDSLTKTIFKNGEAIKSEKYNSGKYISSEKILSRAETVRNKYFQLIILLSLAVGIIILIVKNYRDVSSKEIRYSTSEKILYSFFLPLAVATAINIFSEFIPDAYDAPFKILGDLMLSYIIILPLFLIIIFIIQARKRIDLLWYILLFALLFNLVQEFNQLSNLSIGLSQ